MGRPGKIFAYYISIVLVFAGLEYVIPEDVAAYLSPGTSVEFSPDTALLAEEDSAFLSVFPVQDSASVIISDTLLQNIDTLDKKTKVSLPVVPYLYLNDIAVSHLCKFFRKAYNARKDGITVRVLHMGDSQIEGDRITRYIRESFQQRFGGTGPGLFSVADPYNMNPSVWLVNYGEWIVYDIYNRRLNLEGREYGILGRAVKFVPGTNSGFRFRASPWAQKKAKSFYKVRLFLGELKDTLYMKGYEGNTEIINDTLEKSKGLTEINWEFSNSIQGMKFMFRSKSSPAFLGCALDSLAGVAVDNIALRGQSTPWLLRTNRDLYKTMVNYLDVGLIIFQFGTNMIPTRTYDFNFYRIKIERQLRILRKLAPDCAIIVVGTADAGYLDKGKPKSYDHIPALNKAQKEAALNSGAAFFDLYNAMGGEGTIVKWVNSVPPLAITDYIHFTREGGEKVAGMMLKSIYALADTLSEKGGCLYKEIDKTINENSVKADTVKQLPIK
ncbi:MAG: hypothetical protein GXO47_13945 [Chlorobi bacterium]|nr:hypothetical protein [Chlorobiota bacterium]